MSPPARSGHFNYWARGEENGEEVSPSSSDFGVWESVVSSPSGVSGGAQAENDFILIQYPQIASVDSRWRQILRLFALKSGGTVPRSPENGGTCTLVSPINYAYEYGLNFTFPVKTIFTFELH